MWSRRQGAEKRELAREPWKGEHLSLQPAAASFCAGTGLAALAVTSGSHLAGQMGQQEQVGAEEDKHQSLPWTRHGGSLSVQPLPF